MQSPSSQLKRRDFLRLAGLTGGGFIMGLSLKGNNELAMVANLTDSVQSFELSPFVIIENTGKITLFNQQTGNWPGCLFIYSFIDSGRA